METLKLIMVAGARPNFMKIAPIRRILQEGYAGKITGILVHTGQHYDYEMSQAFFDDLELPPPDYYLGVGSASHAVQTAQIMMAFEKVCLKEHPEVVMVVGDVNSTAACALVAKKLGIGVAHVEAGLRTHNIYQPFPEEVNRVMTSRIADCCKPIFEDCKAVFNPLLNASQSTSFASVFVMFKEKTKSKAKITIKDFILVLIVPPPFVFR